MNTLSWPEGLVDALRVARSIVVMTGAGISAESGIPTFRDALTGWWSRFGEPLPSQALAAAYAAVEGCEVFFSIGTSGLVYPAAGLAELAVERGARVVEINPEPTRLSAQADWSLRARAGTVLPRLVEQVLAEGSSAGASPS
ncbi:MAG: hypothetical protein FJ387_06985 [Verrucomicrobia bacterium]|nr:hypothetical protein [Verrucomicrobiota bacterium]